MKWAHCVVAGAIVAKKRFLRQRIKVSGEHACMKETYIESHGFSIELSRDFSLLFGYMAIILKHSFKVILTWIYRFTHSYNVTN